MNDVTGQRFGRLLAIKATGQQKNGQALWLCRCDCGNLVEIRNHSLKRHTRSCGCLRIEAGRKMGLKSAGRNNVNYKHGEGATRGNVKRLYRIWNGMKSRCFNSRVPCYKWYGGKGVNIYTRWKNDYTVFRDWALSNGYQNNLTIDRIDVNGNYQPDNCQWITQSENSKKIAEDRIQENINYYVDGFMDATYHTV